MGSANVNSAYSALRQNERCSWSAWRAASATTVLSAHLL